MSRFARKVDRNHTDVVDALRAAGVWVVSTAALGNGFPDLLCWCRGMFHLIEIKDGSKPLSARKLTEAEEKFIRNCPGPVHIVTSPVQALIAVGATGPDKAKQEVA